MKETNFRVGIPSTIFYDGEFYLKTTRNFEWELYIRYFIKSTLYKDLLFSAYGPVRIPVSSLSAESPTPFNHTIGLNFQLVVTDMDILEGALKKAHGCVPYNAFSFPTIQYYCPKAQFPSLLKFFRGLQTTWISVRFYYPDYT